MSFFPPLLVYSCRNPFRFCPFHRTPALTPAQRRSLIAEIRARKCVTAKPLDSSSLAGSEYDQVLVIAMKQEAAMADALIDELVKSFGHVRDSLFDPDAKRHELRVLLALCHCYPRLDRKYSAVQSLQLTAIKYKSECDELRTQIVNALSEVALTKPRVGAGGGAAGGLSSPNRLPIVNALMHEKRTSQLISSLPTPMSVHDSSNDKLKLIARARELEANSRAYHARLAQIVGLEIELVESLAKLMASVCICVVLFASDPATNLKHLFCCVPIIEMR